MPDKTAAKKSSKKQTKKVEKSVEDEKKTLALPDGGIEYCIAKIEDLKEQVQRFEHKCTELEFQEKTLSQKYHLMMKEKEDILSHIKHSLDEKTSEVNDLSASIWDLKYIKNAERTLSEKQLKALWQKFQENKDKLTLENMNLAQTMEKVCEQKDMHLAEVVTSLKEQLQKEKQEHKAAIQGLEEKAALERNKLKKEMEERLAEAADKYQTLSEIQIEQQESTDKFRELEKKNASLMAMVKKLKMDLKIVQDLMKETDKKNLECLKMEQRCSLQDTHLKTLASHKHRDLQLRVDHLALQKQYEDLSEKNQFDMDMLTQKEVNEENLKEIVEEEKVKGEQMKMILYSATAMMRNYKIRPPELEMESTDLCSATLHQAANQP